MKHFISPADEVEKKVDMKRRLDSLVPDIGARPDTAWTELIGVGGTKACLKRLGLRLKKRLSLSAAIEPTSECKNFTRP